MCVNNATNAKCSQLSTLEAVCNITGEKSAADRDISEEFSESVDIDSE